MKQTMSFETPPFSYISNLFWLTCMHVLCNHWKIFKSCHEICLFMRMCGAILGVLKALASVSDIVYTDWVVRSISLISIDRTYEIQR